MPNVTGPLVTQETELAFTDNTTNDVSSSKHGYVPKSPGDATKFLNGDATPAWAVPAGPILRGYIDGFILSNNVSDANNDIDIAAGYCSDSTGAAMLTGTALTKRLDANWVVGTNQGGLDTSSKTTSTWYHIFAILKDSDLTVDYLFSTSATSPTMPSGYTYKRRLGAVRTNGSSNILAFSQEGDEFLWSAAVNDANAVAASTTGALQALTVPTNVKVRASFRLLWNGSADALLLTSPDESNQSPGSTPNQYSIVSTALTVTAGEFVIRTNTSGQIRQRATGAVNFTIWTYGWTDLRGKQ